MSHWQRLVRLCFAYELDENNIVSMLLSGENMEVVIITTDVELQNEEFEQHPVILANDDSKVVW